MNVGKSARVLRRLCSPSMPQPVRAVLFDLFDTLVDLALEEMPVVRVDGQLVTPTAPGLHVVLAPHTGLSFPEFVARLRDVDRGLRREHAPAGREIPTLHRFRVLAEALGVDAPGLPEQLTDVHMGALRGQVRAVGHHPEVLRTLGREHRLGLCSNFTHAPTAAAVLEDAGLRECLDAQAISETVGFRKPRREIFDAVLVELGVAPEETLHVGDNLDADVGGAAALGLRTVWITRRVADPEKALARPGAASPDFVIADLAELPALLEKLR